MNYFELFDLPVSIKVDKALLMQKYFGLQKKYHPDFYTQSTGEEQSDALDKSSIINKALKVLQNEDETIKYVLQEKGLLEEEEKYTLPPAFLMEMMELNEASMEEEDTAVLQKTIASVENDLYKNVQPIIENYQEAVTTNEELLQVKEYYYKKKYLQRILDRLGG